MISGITWFTSHAELPWTATRRPTCATLGFARFCNIKYTAANSAEADISNPYVHLTNVSIQRRGEEYNEAHGNKWPLSCLLAWIQVGSALIIHLLHEATNGPVLPSGLDSGGLSFSDSSSARSNKWPLSCLLAWIQVGSAFAIHLLRKGQQMCIWACRFSDKRSTVYMLSGIGGAGFDPADAYLKRYSLHLFEIQILNPITWSAWLQGICFHESRGLWVIAMCVPGLNSQARSQGYRLSIDLPPGQAIFSDFGAVCCMLPLI